MSGRPIPPFGVHATGDHIPPQVFDAFNELIARHWTCDHATFTQEEVVAAVVRRTPNTTREQMHALRWFDVEPAYREVGWVVVYDKPGFNEDYEATFTFKARRRS